MPPVEKKDSSKAGPADQRAANRVVDGETSTSKEGAPVGDATNQNQSDPGYVPGVDEEPAHPVQHVQGLAQDLPVSNARVDNLAKHLDAFRETNGDEIFDAAYEQMNARRKSRDDGEPESTRFDDAAVQQARADEEHAKAATSRAEGGTRRDATPTGRTAPGKVTS
jgi:hypothetical protein